jgi:hypothetical protein
VEQRQSGETNRKCFLPFFPCAFSRRLLPGGGHHAVRRAPLGELQRACNGNLTADGLSSGVFRALGLRCLSATLGVCRAQPGRSRTSGAVLPPIQRLDLRRVGTLRWGCNAALDLCELALGLDPSAVPLPPAFNDLSRDVAWLSHDAVVGWWPRPPEKAMSATGSPQLPIASNQGRGGIRYDVHRRHLAAAGRPAANSLLLVARQARRVPRGEAMFLVHGTTVGSLPIPRVASCVTRQADAVRP